MKVSDKGLAEIAGHEGIVQKRYLDSVRVWTIGIGHTSSAGDPNPAQVTRELSISEVMDIFRRDIERFEHRVNDAVKVSLKQHEFDALVSFDFNTGGIYRAKLTKHLNAGHKAAAAKAFMGWVKPKEIKPRREAERDLFKTGQYGDGFATVLDASPAGRVKWGSGKRVDVLSIVSRKVRSDGIITAPEGYAPKPKPKPPVVEVMPPPPPKPETSIWTTLAAFIGRFFRIGQ